MATKFDKRLKWLEPYFDAVRPIVGKRVTHVKAKSPRWSSLGEAHENDGQGVTIYIRLGEKAEDMIHTFAHELAHVEHWDHGPDHLYLTGLLFWKFTTVAGWSKETFPFDE